MLCYALLWYYILYILLLFRYYIVIHPEMPRITVQGTPVLKSQPDTQEMIWNKASGTYVLQTFTQRAKADKHIPAPCDFPSRVGWLGQ